ncbi:ribbon-helix-helix domain-containing protein [Methanosarcina sp. MTP4]|uniref:ribbon-helix-helix domain-containing protein n=1 Tax=Methanosarcina sp. MTP4 TaxID=1434100 RepID=UPI00064EA0D0|nr:ribbon-helix-helix domain-containing protein [Methanosarcina sp. MTP4]
MTIQYKKEKISSTISPYLKNRIDEFVDSGEFSSVSDFVNTAIAEFIAKYDERVSREIQQSETKLPEIMLNAILQTGEGRELLASLCKADL